MTDGRRTAQRNARIAATRLQRIKEKPFGEFEAIAGRCSTVALPRCSGREMGSVPDRALPILFCRHRA